MASASQSANSYEFSLVIKRAFAPNQGKDGKKMFGTSKKKVHQIMSQFGTIAKIDQITKTDFKTKQKFYMFFVHYSSKADNDTIDDNLRVLDEGGHLEVMYNQHKNFWYVEKFVKREKTTSKYFGVVAVSKKQETKED